MRHDRELVRQLSRDTGLSRKTIKRGLDDLISAGHLAHDERGYLALVKAEPPADQAGGSLVLGLPSTPIGHPASQGGRNDE